MKQLDSFLRCMLKYPPPRVSGILLACLLLFASCGGDDSSDESYAAIESGSFTFDETDDANNAVRVMANGAWQVYWEPASAAVTADPSSGVGNGTFRVKEMPPGNVRQSRGAHRFGQGLRQDHHRDPCRGSCRSDALARSRGAALQPCGR